jgi:hypothetical protein
MHQKMIQTYISGKNKILFTGGNFLKFNLYIFFTFFLTISVFGMSHSINVKEFGAKGDGIADDTAAIEKASRAAIRYAMGIRSKAGYRFNITCIGEGPQKEIIFPAGTYRITRPILFLRYTTLKGEGKVIIHQENSEKDIFFFSDAFRCRIENLSFEGGATQIRVWTNNNDSANILVRGCNFRNSSKSAIECLSFRLPVSGGKWKISSPYKIKNDTIIDSVDLSKAIPAPNSTLFVIDKCFFDNCYRAAALACDGAVVRNSKVVSARNFTGGVFHLRNKPHLYNLDILIRRNPDLEQSAVECYSRTLLCFNDSVIRTDNGKGVCTVSSEAKPGYAGSSIVLRNLKTESGPSPGNAVLYLKNNTIPNGISINGITETSGKRVKAVGFQFKPTGKSLSDNRRFKSIPEKKTYTFTIGKNSKNVDSTVPNIIRQYQVCFPEIRKPFPRPVPRDFKGKVFHASDFGVDYNVKSDDTAGVKKVFAEAAKHPGSKVIFPGAWIELSDTVEIPANISLDAFGVAAFRMKNENKALFTSKHPESLKFSNLILQGGKHALSIKPHKTETGSVFFDNCYFYDFSSYAVHVEAEKCKKKTVPLQILMNGGANFTAKLYEGNASLVYSDAQWLSTLPEGPKDQLAEECVVFRNYGGNLELVDFLGVPMAFAWTTPEKIAPEGTRPRDYRWIDNFGNLHCFNVRFGGEWGGICPVFNYGNGFVTIEGGYAWFETARIPRFPVVATPPLGKFELFNVQCSPNLKKPVTCVWRGKNGSIYPVLKQKIVNVFPR